MSHTTLISSIVITDVHALRAAIHELNREGVKCDLLTNATPRAYYSNQQGLGEADYVVKLDGSRYDVGLYQNDELGGLEARADFWAGEVAGKLGAAHKDGVDPGQAKLGKLYQTYGVCAAERQAINQGYTSQRNTQADGTVQLTLTAA